ncbi:MAG: carbohydrate kinase [Proteobacteria bacterium]|nr:carbohydrate kinase [Pseudomonadota bacterium]
MDVTIERFKEIIDRFKETKIAVIGDIVADIYVYGKPFKLSREAPVLVVRHDGQEILPGSAGNTINNLAHLGARVFPISVLGDDEAGKSLLTQFSKMKVEMDGLISAKNLETITKTRIMAGDEHTSKQQVIRIDRETKGTLPKAMEDRMMTYLDRLSNEIDAFIVADYGYDTATQTILDRIKAISVRKIVVADSRYRLNLFSGITAITPNESEAEAISRQRIASSQEAIQVGQKLVEELNLKAILITRGNKGMVLVEQSGNTSDLPICGTDEITDVTGAGDTVAAVFAASLATGASFYEAARLSNYAGAVVVMKGGTATASPNELIDLITWDLGTRG